MEEDHFDDFKIDFAFEIYPMDHLVRSAQSTDPDQSEAGPPSEGGSGSKGAAAKGASKGKSRVRFHLPNSGSTVDDQGTKKAQEKTIIALPSSGPSRRLAFPSHDSRLDSTSATNEIKSSSSHLTFDSFDWDTDEMNEAFSLISDELEVGKSHGKGGGSDGTGALDGSASNGKVKQSLIGLKKASTTVNQSAKTTESKDVPISYNNRTSKASHSSAPPSRVSYSSRRPGVGEGGASTMDDTHSTKSTATNRGGPFRGPPTKSPLIFPHQLPQPFRPPKTGYGFGAVGSSAITPPSLQSFPTALSGCVGSKWTRQPLFRPAQAASAPQAIVRAPASQADRTAPSTQRSTVSATDTQTAKAARRIQPVASALSNQIVNTACRPQSVIQTKLLVPSQAPQLTVNAPEVGQPVNIDHISTPTVTASTSQTLHTARVSHPPFSAPSIEPIHSASVSETTIGARPTQTFHTAGTSQPAINTPSPIAASSQPHHNVPTEPGTSPSICITPSTAKGGNDLGVMDGLTATGPVAAYASAAHASYGSKDTVSLPDPLHKVPEIPDDAPLFPHIVTPAPPIRTHASAAPTVCTSGTSRSQRANIEAIDLSYSSQDSNQPSAAKISTARATALSKKRHREVSEEEEVEAPRTKSRLEWEMKVSSLGREVCEGLKREMAGLQRENAGLKRENAILKKAHAGSERERIAADEKVAQRDNEIATLTSERDASRKLAK